MPEQTVTKYQEIHPEGRYELEVLAHQFEDGYQEGDRPILKFVCKVKKFLRTKAGTPMPSIILGGTRTVSLLFNEDNIERTREFIKKTGVKDVTTLDKKGPDNPRHVSLEGYTFEANCAHRKGKAGTKSAGKTFDAFYVVDDTGGAQKWLKKESVSTDKLRGIKALWGSASTTESAAVKQTIANVKQQPVQDSAPADGPEPFHEDLGSEPDGVDW